MSLDPATAQSWANVYGGGLAGAIIATLLSGNIIQFWTYRSDRREWDREREAIAERHADAFESIRKAADAKADRLLSVSERLLLVTEELGRRIQRRPSQAKEGT